MGSDVCCWDCGHSRGWHYFFVDTGCFKKDCKCLGFKEKKVLAVAGKKR